MIDKFYNNEHFSPDYVRENPIIIRIKSVVDKTGDTVNFATLTHKDLVRGSIKLTQTLCSEKYFLWGGFNASRLEFECISDELINAAPSGKIQLTITPTVYTNGVLTSIIEAEETALFTGYVETAEPDNVPGHWTVTAYDRLYRVRNCNVVSHINTTLQIARQNGKRCTFDELRQWTESQLWLFTADNVTLPAFTKTVLFPDNQDITGVNGIDLLRDFALCCKRFGILNGEGKLDYVDVQDSATGSECYRINNYCPNDFDVSSGQVWLPKYFLSEPRTNLFYTTADTTSEDDYKNNWYTISSNVCIGDEDWRNENFECDEYGAPSSKYNANNLPPRMFNVDSMNLTNGEEYYCQEYKIKVLSDPTIPMGSIIHVYKNGSLVVKSYIMERTITFSSTQTIECEMSASNAPYNEAVPELDAGVRSANAKANEISAKMPFISDGSSLTKLRACKVISKDDYNKLSEKRDDTIYYVYDTGGDNS